MSELQKLSAEWLKAKSAENTAKDARVAIEEQIIAITGNREDGQETHDDGDYKITIKGVLNRKLDVEKWNEIKNAIPTEFHPVEMKPSLVVKGVKWLEEHEPGYYNVLAQALEVAPGKTQVKVERKNS
jgi:hypothetical protein